MYQIQEDKLNYFEKQIDNPNRKITYKFSLNDESIQANQIMDNPSITYDCGLDQYGVGCALVTQLQMSVKSDVLIIPNDKIAIQVGLDIYNEVTQQWETIYTPLGVFYVDTIEEKGIKKSIKAYDGMYKLNKGYFPSAKHTTTQAIANDIATSNGYKIKGISNVTINNEQLEGKTCLEMLSLVASAIGGHVRISRDGSTIEFIEPTNYGETYDESDYTTPTVDDATSYNITKLRVNYSDQVTNDEGTVTDEGYYEVGSGTDANTLAISNPLLKGQKSQAQIILDKVKRLNGYKRFDTSMPLADFRLEPMDIITYIKGEKEYIVPILYMKMTLSYKGISIETQSPTVAETKTEFSFKGTLSQKVENIYTDIIQVKQLTANKVTTDELEATVAKIEQLYVTKVDADEIYANKAEIGDLVAGSIVVEDLKSQVAQVEDLLATKANITDLNAINATIGTLKANVAEIDDLIANSIISEIIQSGSVSSDLLNIKNGFIKDAMIDSVTASKINSGVINTNNVTIQSSNGNMKLQGNLLQFKDKNGKVRIQIGQDTSGNYTFTLYDSTGTGVLINEKGIQSSNAIKDGLIVDSKVASNANISGSKLNISSVYDSMNANGSKTLKASKVYLDDKKQTLDVSFKEMTTKQDELEDSMSTTITDLSVEKGKISQLIQDTTITTSGGTTKLKDAYNSTKSTVDSHTTQIGKMQTTINANTGEITSTKNEVATIKADLNEIELGLSSVEKNIGDNYYTKSQTDSQIKATKDSINLGISQTYETKTNVTSQVSSALTSAKSYADTKKSEAISTASSDATSKANNALSSAKSYTDTAKNDLNTAIGKKANSSDVYTKTQVYTKAQTDSAIKVAKDSINLGVSNTYETKTNVTSKVSSTLSSAKSYADTKKTEAIASAKNTLDTTIANYYTKAQTDSQIKIAKDAIDLSVKNTYETKTNVTSKVNSAISTASSDATTKANNALTSAKSYADTKKSEAITSANNTLNTTIANYYTKTQTDSAIKLAKDSVTTQVGKVEEIASSSLQGKMLYTDPTFTSGVNGMTVYNNSGNGTVTITRITKSSDCPTTSGYMIQIKTTGTASPSHGGFYFGTQTRNNAIFVTKIIAKIPSGYTLNFATNGIGTGGGHKWLTANSGTGNWKEYIYKVTCGNGGTLSSTNFFYLSGGSVATTSSPVTWYVAMATTFDITATDNLEKRLNTAEQKITPTAIVSTVTSSTEYKNNLTGKVDKTEIISSINQTAESIKISANKIALTGSVVIGAINGSTTNTTYISGNKIRAGSIASTDNSLLFDLNNAYIRVNDPSGNRVGVTVRNVYTGTSVYGMSTNAEYNSYVGLGVKTSTDASTYTLFVTCIGKDGLVGGYKTGVNIGQPLYVWHPSTFSSSATFSSTTNFKSTANFTTTYATNHRATQGNFDQLRTYTSPNNSATDIKVYDNIHMNYWNIKQAGIEWNGFSRSSGDYIKFQRYNATSESALRLILADDTKTYFSIINNHYQNGLKSIAYFKGATGTASGSADSVKMHMYGTIDLHKWGIINTGWLYGSTIKSLSLEVESDTVTVQSSSPVVLNTGDDFTDINVPTKTQYLGSHTTNTISHHGTVVVSDKADYVELPSDFIMCENIHVVATPNKLCQYAITSVDEYGFVIECDKEDVTFTYQVVADKIDVMSLTERKTSIVPDSDSVEDNYEDTPVECKEEEIEEQEPIEYKEVLVEVR